MRQMPAGEQSILPACVKEFPNIHGTRPVWHDTSRKPRTVGPSAGRRHAIFAGTVASLRVASHQVRGEWPAQLLTKTRTML
jgi:hypothetical protein